MRGYHRRGLPWQNRLGSGAVMDNEMRRFFDEQLDLVLAELPQQVKDFMEEVPLVVDDVPSAEIMRRMRVRHPANLLGLYTGIPLTAKSINHSGVMPDKIHIFRLGIMRYAQSREVGENAAALCEQIRRTIMHEYGHHVGLTERDLRELGYG